MSEEKRHWSTPEERAGFYDLVVVMRKIGLAAMVFHLGEAAVLGDPDPCAASLLFAIAASVSAGQTQEFWEAMKPVVEKLRADNMTRLKGSAK